MILRQTIAALFVGSFFALACTGFARADDVAIERIADQLVRAETSRGRFVQERYLSVLSHPLVSEGDFVFERGKSVQWNVEKPFPSTMIANQSGVFYQGQNAQPAADGFGRLLLTLLDLDFAVLEQSFSVTGELMDAGWQIHLVPRNEQWRLAVEAIHLNGAAAIETVVVMEKGGDKLQVTFSEITHEPDAENSKHLVMTGE